MSSACVAGLLTTDHTSLFRQIRFAENSFRADEERNNTMHLGRAPTASSVQPSRFLSDLPCATAGQLLLIKIACLTCQKPIDVRSPENEGTESEGTHEEDNEEDGSLVRQAERAGMCLPCYASYAQQKLVVRLHAEIVASTKAIEQMMGTLSRIVDVLSSTEIIDFGSDFLAALDLHYRVETALDDANRAIAHFRLLKPRSPTEALLIANILQALRNRIKVQVLQFRVRSCQVRKLRLQQAEQIFLRYLAFSSEVQLNAGAAAILAPHLNGLAQTFKRDIALQLVMGEAQISWKAYSATLKEKIERHPHGQMLGLKNPQASFEGTVLRKATGFLLQLRTSMEGKHLEAFLKNTFAQLSLVIEFLQKITS